MKLGYNAAGRLSHRKDEETRVREAANSGADSST